MATKIYDTEYVSLIDGTRIELSPLKIKYLREVMELFDTIKSEDTGGDTLLPIIYAAIISMKQFRPSLRTRDDIEDNFDLQTLYKVLDIGAGIKLAETDSENVDAQKERAEEAASREGGWAKLDLAKLEAEVFTMGIWKNYAELETSLSLPELITTLNIKRELDYSEKKFLAAMQGVDLDKESGKDSDNAWEKMKARVFSGGQSSDPKDIVSFQGVNAEKAGFGIGMGLDYQKI